MHVCFIAPIIINNLYLAIYFPIHIAPYAEGKSIKSEP